MTNDQVKLARQWAETRNPISLSEDARAARDYILATTPKPTMAEVEWDDEKHHLAGATTPAGDEVVMMWVDEHECFDNEVTPLIVSHVGSWDPESLTPNGKRYELREAGTVSPDETVGEGETTHPRTLATVEDYENAPEGTIIAVPGKGTTAVQKLGNNEWGIVSISVKINDEDCARASADHGAATVLRWGDEA